MFKKIKDFFTSLLWKYRIRKDRKESQEKDPFIYK